MARLYQFEKYKFLPGVFVIGPSNALLHPLDHPRNTSLPSPNGDAMVRQTMLKDNITNE
jgi:hypothetical protein